jgi:hypothetical protein
LLSRFVTGGDVYVVNAAELPCKRCLRAKLNLLAPRSPGEA